MTDIIIVHSKHGDSSNHWYEWLENNLILEGYDVTLFNIAIESNDNLAQWIEEMKRQISVKKEDTYFVTHGFGTLAALKYIELADMPVVEGLFSIAGFKDDAQAISEDLNTQDFTLNYDIIKSKVGEFYGLCAKNDQQVSYKETQRLIETLDGTCKVTESGGHFTEEDGFSTFIKLQSKMQAVMSS
ncbi:serine hydrolase family protein [Staphylococcus arlettae]|uniref:Alpha/beta hydrolase n=1 Tax=Staphylococcus arlettae TaxID=29378 RepID=A0A380CA64_9STAP|nr:MULTISPECIES: alpha/beta hydrolase [Staphylococcus]EJY95157.1 hypothetical protein SARL_09121 [Staphylococcus arlettae CVD059]ERF49265.1 alpha/beta hydrolase [Staphylococcus sp. EGD-HP3]MCD8816790.1 alpha/beta hydrolase [Staphylococcus arlettae]MCD8833721.1 alpha/beta hydrolase [Staphylococcus arlettae]MCD8838467.1 alpha/beta hydrolase [Staphylococcus arlettae]